MYSKFFLATQVILWAFLAQAGSSKLEMGAKGFAATLNETNRVYSVADDNQVRRYVNQSVAQIHQIANQNWTPVQKLRAIEERVENVKKYRSTNFSKSAKTEMDMDFQIRPFESFPAAKDFKLNRCNEYQNRVMVDWDPQAAEGQKPSERGVDNALKILKVICRG